MFHSLEFTVGCRIDIEVTNKDRLERVQIQAGTRVRAQLRPYVAETTNGPVEVADLFLDDGSTVRHVPFAYFAFVD
ncbi:MAG: hypothetical protein K2R98_25085 [Gemmataceae bacterium]|nr:hypothetical protein [Gemmataceae bacterium]